MKLAILVVGICILESIIAAPIDVGEAFAGLPELAQGNVPAEDYVVVEVNKPIAHYFAAANKQSEESRVEKRASYDCYRYFLVSAFARKTKCPEKPTD